MKPTNLHLDLLRDDEKFSSSPVRLRVMLPVLGGLMCLAMCVWWASAFAQLQIARGELRVVRGSLEESKNAHAGAVDDITVARELQGEIDQLSFYVKGRRTWGQFLARLADAVPARVQLTTLVIPEAAAQQLNNPQNPKMPTLLGPTNDVELVTVRMTGRTSRSEPVTKFMETLAEKQFADWLVIGGTGKTQSPRIRSFNQESAANASEGRLLTFDLEYRAAARRFAK